MSKNLPDPVDTEIERLYMTYQRLVYDYIYKQLKCSVQEAEDRTAEVFERASRNLKGQSETETFPKPKSWLMKITENVCSKFFIDTGEHEAFSLERYASFDEEDGSYIAFEDDRASRPENMAEQHELTMELSEIIAALPPEQQRAILLHYLDGWPYSKISREAYSNSAPRAPSTVRNDTRRGIEHLRVRLNHMEP